MADTAVKEKQKKPINRKMYSGRVDIILLTALEDLSKQTEKNKSVLVDEALELLFRKYKFKYKKRKKKKKD